MARQPRDPPTTPKRFGSLAELDRGVARLSRRLIDLENADVVHASREDSGELQVLESDIREAIRETFGENSPELREHQYLSIWGGPMGVDPSQGALDAGRTKGKTQAVAILKGLLRRLDEKRAEFPEPGPAVPVTPHGAAWSLLHSSVRAAVGDRFEVEHYADAVEAAFKELSSTVRQLLISRGGQELDGVSLMQTAFSPNKPLIVLADLSTASGRDMQRGYMDMFAGAMFAIRNPKAHGNVTITRERALHLLFVASTLWYTLDQRP